MSGIVCQFQLVSENFLILNNFIKFKIVGSGPVVFTEVIAATNANLVINVLEECGHPVQFVQAI